MSRVAALLVTLLCGAAVTSAYDWSAVDAILEAGIANQTYPGCVAVVADKTGVVYAKAHGSFTYGIPPPFSGGVNPPMTMETRFDMASCTKVLASTTSAALLYQWGYLDLDTPVADPEYLGPEFAQNGKESVTVRHCLLHNAGFPPDPEPNYWDKAFDCPETRKTVPEENFSCRAKWWDSLLKQGLARAPNVAYVYSDLSLITIGMIVGKIAYTRNLVSAADILPGCLTDAQNPTAPPTQAAIYQCYFEAFFRTQVADALGLRNTGFLPPQSVWGQCAPAENDTIYAGKTIQGQVSDGNTYAMGGIAGHAGLFTTAMEVLTIMQTWLFGTHPELLSPAVAKYFYTEHNHTQSSRALGWNTNDPDAFDQGWALSCGSKLSAATFMHTGYTGTEVCADPQFPTGGLITILLTNRVYPTDRTGSAKIGNIRRLFNNAVADTLLSKQDL